MKEVGIILFLIAFIILFAYMFRHTIQFGKHKIFKVIMSSGDVRYYIRRRCLLGFYSNLIYYCSEWSYSDVYFPAIEEARKFIKDATTNFDSVVSTEQTE